MIIKGELKTEISPTSRATCNKCDMTILKGEIRVAHKYTNQYSHINSYFYHLNCVLDELLDTAKKLYKG